MECNITYVRTYMCMYLYIYIRRLILGRIIPELSTSSFKQTNLTPYPWVSTAEFFICQTRQPHGVLAPSAKLGWSQNADVWPTTTGRFTRAKSGFHPEKCGLIILLGDLPAVCLSHKAHGFRIPTWLVWSPVHVGCLFTHDHIWVVRLGHRSTS